MVCSASAFLVLLRITNAIAVNISAVSYTHLDVYKRQLPHGTGKEVRVLVLCTPDAEAAAKEAGADYVGLDEYIEKIKGGWTDIEVIITMPSIMGKIGALGRVLGPRGLMPNPKSGTVTMDVAKAVKERCV